MAILLIGSSESNGIGSNTGGLSELSCLASQACCQISACSRQISREARRADQAARQHWVRRTFHSFKSNRRSCRNPVKRRAERKRVAILLSWRILVLIGVGLHPAAVLSSDRAAHADTAGRMARVEQGIFSIADAIKQNSIGFSEGTPAGVPRSYNWYKGWSLGGQQAAPPGFTAVTGWGQVYQDSSEPTYTNPNAQVEVANARTYVHLRSTGAWLLVQDQSNNPIAGGHFVPDFAGNSGYAIKVTSRNGGAASFAAPPDGYNDHFWPTARGTFAEGDVDAVYVQMDMRVTDPNLNLIANIGADWWRDVKAPYLDDHSNNPGAGGSNWVDLSTEWRTLAFFSSRTVFRAHPPPPLVGTSAEMPPLPPGIRKPRHRPL